MFYSETFVCAAVLSPSMASQNEPAPSQDKKNDDEKPAANGVKKDEAEELVRTLRMVTYTNKQSEEDQTLKNELEMLVERLKVRVPSGGMLTGKENDASLYPASLESLKTLIRTSTSSMTAMPKPLKFLRPHYRDLQKRYEEWPASTEKVCSFDVSL